MSNCAVNLLLNGFYNFCSERSTVTERNYAHIVHGRIYMDHDETDNQVEEHKCELTAYCRACNTELPWPLYELRDIDGARPQVAQEMVTALLSKINRGQARERRQNPHESPVRSYPTSIPIS